MANPKFYYHLTQDLTWPDKIILYPRIEGQNRSDDEPLVPRTCVAPTIEGCIIALGSCLALYYTTYIYRTVNKVLARNPYSVNDSHITKEKWITKPITFKLVGVLNDFLPEDIYWISTGGYSDLKYQKKYMKKLQKMKLSFVDWV